MVPRAYSVYVHVPTACTLLGAIYSRALFSLSSQALLQVRHYRSSMEDEKADIKDYEFDAVTWEAQRFDAVERKFQEVSSASHTT
jgi:hypothetical protein